jgi:hypothetical protein
VKQFFPTLRKVPQLNPSQRLVKSDQIIPVNYDLNRHKAPSQKHLKIFLAVIKTT